jgi:hypothetical protein
VEQKIIKFIIDNIWLILAGAAAVLSVCFLIWTLLDSRKRKIEAIKNKDKPKPNTVLHDEIKGRDYAFIDYDKILDPNHPEHIVVNDPTFPGIPRRYRGGEYYFIKKDRAGNMSVIAPPVNSRWLPEDLYEARHDQSARLYTAGVDFWKGMVGKGMLAFVGIMALMLIIVRGK